MEVFRDEQKANKNLISEKNKKINLLKKTHKNEIINKIKEV